MMTVPLKSELGLEVKMEFKFDTLKDCDVKFTSFEPLYTAGIYYAYMIAQSKG